jgi:outer membrane protein assembly factor BamD (BamD/ComL family)
MKTTTYLLIAGLAGFIISCSPSREKRIERISAMEKSLFAPDAYSFNQVKADSLVAMYVEFIAENPKDSLSASYLFKTANIVMNGGDGNKALGYFDQYIKDFPDGPKVSMCMFFKGFVYENMLGNLDKAREVYLQFIEKYPNDDFVDDAQMALMNLGKSPEMLIREFEAKQKADSIRTADSLAKSKPKPKRNN